MRGLEAQRGFRGKFFHRPAGSIFEKRLTIYLAVIVPTPEGTPTESSGYAVVFGCLVVVIFLVVASVAGYDFLDSSGWVSHSRSVNLYISGDWITGESRSCLGLQSRLPGEPPEITSLDCRIDGSAENPHDRNNIEVKFFGKISRPDLLVSETTEFKWRCRREGDRFTCYASN